MVNFKIQDGFHILLPEKDEYLYEEHLYSNCCKAPVWAESDRCSKCGEHCKVMKECDQCNDGMVYLGRVEPATSLIDTCDCCEGGEIEL